MMGCRRDGLATRSPRRGSVPAINRLMLFLCLARISAAIASERIRYGLGG